MPVSTPRVLVDSGRASGAAFDVWIFTGRHAQSAVNRALAISFANARQVSTSLADDGLLARCEASGGSVHVYAANARTPHKATRTGAAGRIFAVQACWREAAQERADQAYPCPSDCWHLASPSRHAVEGRLYCA